MTAYAEILYELDGAAAVITLNRPQTLNALTDLTQAEVRHALDASERNADVDRHGAYRRRARLLLRRGHERPRRHERSRPAFGRRP